MRKVTLGDSKLIKILNSRTLAQHIPQIANIRKQTKKCGCHTPQMLQQLRRLLADLPAEQIDKVKRWMGVDTIVFYVKENGQNVQYTR